MNDDEVQFRPCKWGGCTLDAEVVDKWTWDSDHDTGPPTDFFSTECAKKHRLFGVTYD